MKIYAYNYNIYYKLLSIRTSQFYYASNFFE